MLLTLSWDKNWDSHSLVNGYPSFYPRIALVVPGPDDQIIGYWQLKTLASLMCDKPHEISQSLVSSVMNLGEIH